MPVIGLTGSIASGKSLVSNIMRDLGASVVDADLVARDVVKPGSNGLQQLVRAFGSDILNADGSLNRKVLGARVFANKEQMVILNGVTHPLIYDKIKAEIERFREQSPGQVLVIDAPLLVEVGLHRIVDEVWLVQVDRETQIRRLIQRDKLSLEQAMKRINSQLSNEEKARFADVVIDNSLTAEYTKSQVERIWKDRFEKSGVENIGSQQE